MSTDAIEEAFRTRLTSLVVCGTGLQTLQATVTGYRRTTGSFVADGFAAGMECVPVGFASNPVQVVEDVTALTLTMRGARAAQGAGSNRSIQVGLPQARVWENTRYTPDPNTCYVETELLSQAGTLLSFPAELGTREERGLYLVRWYGLQDMGKRGLSRCVDAARALFTPNTVLTAGAFTVRLRGDECAYPSSVLRVASGHALVTLTIPWRLYRLNVVAG